MQPNDVIDVKQIVKIERNGRRWVMLITLATVGAGHFIQRLGC